MLEQKKSLVFVDNDKSFCKSLELGIKPELEERGWEVVVCQNGKSALTEIQGRLNDLLVLVTDFEMPGMDGLELIEETGKIVDSSRTRIFIATGYHPILSGEKNIQVSLDGVLNKMDLYEELIEKGRLENVFEN